MLVVIAWTEQFQNQTSDTDGLSGWVIQIHLKTDVQLFFDVSF